MKKDGTLDLRIKRTQKAIKESFFELVDKKGFEHITVKDITDGAMISRNTFYLHYADKYDLLNRICDDLMRTLFFRVGKQLRKVQKQGFSAESVSSILLLAINAIEDDKEQYSALFNSSSSDKLTEKITGVIKRCIDIVNDDAEIIISGFSLEYTVSGIIGLIKYYSQNEIENIERDCLDFTDLHLGKIIDRYNELRSDGYEKK